MCKLVSSVGTREKKDSEMHEKGRNERQRENLGHLYSVLHSLNKIPWFHYICVYPYDKYHVFVLAHLMGVCYSQPEVLSNTANHNNLICQ